MKTNSELIQEVFNEYGIRLTLAFIDRQREMMLEVDYCWKTPKDYSKTLFSYLGKGRSEFTITDFEKFREKCGLSERWKGVPKWFYKQNTLGYYKERNGFSMPNLKNPGFDLIKEKFYAKETSYFSELIEVELTEEEKVKMLFETDIIIDRINNEVMHSYWELDREIVGNSELKVFYTKIFKVTRKCFKEDSQKIKI